MTPDVSFKAVRALAHPATLVIGEGAEADAADLPP